jgi:HPt (histidine-containing phosphotransfer) domain-containing protein
MKHYDLQALEKLDMGNREFTTKMVRMFLSHTPDLLAHIEVAGASQDLESVARIAHKLKSGIDALGISEVRADIKILERVRSENVNESELEEIIIRLVSHVKRTMTELRHDFNIP